MKKEKIHIKKKKLRDIINGDNNEKFIVIKDEITSSDPEDGGADHTLILKRNLDGHYFRLYYSDWDWDYNFKRDFPENLEEVFPKEKTITVYE